MGNYTNVKYKVCTWMVHYESSLQWLLYLLSVDMVMFYLYCYILRVNLSTAIVIIILQISYEDDIPCPIQCIDAGKNSQLVVWC